MKYIVNAIDLESEREVETTVSVRSDARLEKVVEKSVLALMPVLGLRRCRYTVDMPNAWRNGAVGTLTIDRRYSVGIRGEWNETYMFLP